MIKKLMIERIKNKSTYIAFIILLIYGIFLYFVHDFALWTCSVTDKIYFPMKSFYSIYSGLSMTFIFLPLYLYWIYSFKSKSFDSLIMIRYQSFNKFMKFNIIKSIIEASYFNLLLILILIFSSLKYLSNYMWFYTILQIINTFIGLFIISMIANIFYILFREKSFLSGIFSYLQIIIGYIFFVCRGFPVLLKIIVVYDKKNIANYVFDTIHGIIFSLIIIILYSVVLPRKSYY